MTALTTPTMYSNWLVNWVTTIIWFIEVGLLFTGAFTVGAIVFLRSLKVWHSRQINDPEIRANHPSMRGKL